MESQAPNSHRELRAGMLTICRRLDGEAEIVELHGELDLANAATLEAELEDAGRDGRVVVVDMTLLTFIDSTGIALLVAALARDGSGQRLQFVPSTAPAVTRVLALTGVDERLPRSDAGRAAAVL
jgi:anti-sigma B factor antagonist